MNTLVVKPVETRRERALFLEFPWKHYAGDPYWIPPLRMNQKEMVGYSHNPFYDRNLVQTFLAFRGTEVCGRVAAILNRGHNERFHERRGFFGFFESINDQEVADGLLGEVRQWFASQGIFNLRGPANPSLNHEVGLLVQGFESSPTFMMTYNPPYYEHLIENFGFRKSQDLFAYTGHISILPTIEAKLKPVAEQIIERYNVVLRPLDRNNFLADVRAFLNVYNRSLLNTWGFVPMSDEEVRHTAKSLQYLIVPELAIGAEIDGKMVGATFTLPDYNPRIRQIDGRLFPLGIFRLLRNKQLIKHVRVISTNVVPEYQRYGIGLALMHGLMPKAMAWEIEEAEFSWVLESNLLSRGSLEKGGAKLTKVYRVYDLDQAPSQITDAAAVVRPQVVTTLAERPRGELEIREVRSSADFNQFVRVPWRIYAKDPNWVPPLLMDVKEFLNRRKHPFYRHGEATQFLALRDGVPWGRILVSDDPHYNEQANENLGCFGMFESANDPEMAAALLSAAANWLKARGRTAIRGPIDYSMNYPCGLLIDGFDTPSRALMNHNPIYYPALLESWGLRKAKDLYAWWFSHRNDLVARWKERVDRIVRRTGIRVRPFRRKDFAADLRRCIEVYDASMHDNWGFVRMSEAEIQYMAQRLNRLADPEQVLLAEQGDQPVGFAVTIPDWNDIIRPLDGRLTRYGLPIGLLQALRRRKHVRVARVLVLDIKAEFRGRGVAEMLILRTFDYGMNVRGFTDAELSWTLEDNAAINRVVEKVGAQRYKTYRIYQREI